MAAPKVAGAAGVIIARHGKNNLSPVSGEGDSEAIRRRSLQKGCDEKSGFGLVSIPSALNRR